MNYVRELGFKETPDYDFLRKPSTKMLNDSNKVDNGVMVWMLLNGGKGREGLLQGSISPFVLIQRPHTD
jgi:casein kinase 1